MDYNPKEIISNSKLAKSITNTKLSLTKRELLLKLGIYDVVRVEASREEYHLDTDIHFKTDADGNICYYRLETVVPEITDEEYDMLLPYIHAANTSSTKSRNLKVYMIIWWILTIASIIITLVCTPWSIARYVILALLVEISFFQMFASAIYQNAKNCENLNKTLLSLAFRHLLERVSNKNNK